MDELASQNENYPTFFDRPNRNYVNRMSRVAQTSLVGFTNGRWENITTVYYAYTVSRGGVIVFPIPSIIINPTPWTFHQNSINNAK